MGYEALAQQALRGVVRLALERVSAQGLPGEHHFYITFDTNFPGVEIAEWLRQRYPEEMTIVLQHEFWGLTIRPDGFDVTLRFQKIGEKLTVPFDAVKAFFDPSVQFMLQFKPVSGTGGKKSAPPAASLPVRKEEAAPEKSSDDTPPDDPKPTGGGEVVSLDKFRKK